MKIIDKVIDKNKKYSKEELLSCYCPLRFGYKNCKTDNQDECLMTCEECWNREETDQCL